MAGSQDTTRRSFLVLTGTGAVGLVAGCSGTPSSTDDPNNGQASVPASDSPNTPVEQCTITEADISGPYYLPDVPVRNELDLYNDPGTGLTLSGQVLDAACKPIENAIVEIWHADPTTVAVDSLTAADSVDYDNDSPQMRYRGQIATNASGRYSFHTKKPGWYLNGETFRPMHIHMKVWVNGQERLTTQVYFEGDPHLQGDPWASPSRTVAINSNGQNEESVVFDIVV